jgi:hypothetical protein
MTETEDGESKILEGFFEGVITMGLRFTSAITRPWQKLTEANRPKKSGINMIDFEVI